MAGVCLLLALVGWWLYYLRATAIQDQVRGTIADKVAIMQGFETKVNNTEKDIKQISTTAEPLTQAIEARQYWAELISALNYSQPKQFVWITQLEPTVAGKPIAIEDPTKPLGSGLTTNAAVNPVVRAPGAAAPKAPMIDGVHVKGLYLSNPQQDQIVSEFVRNLAKSSFFKLDPTKENTIVTVRTPQDDKSWAFVYELQLPLARPLPLQ